MGVSLVTIAKAVLAGMPLLRLRSNTRFSFSDYLDKQTRKYAVRPFILFEDRTITYSEFDAMANQVAQWGRSVGLVAGDTIGLMMQNRPEFVAAWCGMQKLGVRVALLNTNLAASAIAHALRAADASRLVLGAECMANARCLDEHGLNELSVYVLVEAGHEPTDLPSDWDDITSDLAAQPGTDPQVHRGIQRAGDPAIYIYTSGTTGLPKAVQWSQYRVAATGVAGAVFGFGRHDVMYCPLPLYHAAGGMGAIMMALGSGGAVAIARKFSATRFWDDVRRYEATAFIYIGEICRFLLNQPPRPDDGEHGIKFMFGIGLRADIWEAFKDRFRIPEIYEGYSASESNTGMINRTGKPGSIGKPSTSVLLLKYDVGQDEYVRDANGRFVECATGEVGEILGKIAHSRTSMIGRFDGYTDPAATEKKILRNVKKPGDAWFRSGDLLKRDAEGYYYFVDRIGDTFRWRGENVSTQEVAEALSVIPEVETTNVYGVIIPGSEGRAGMAAVVLKEGAEFDGSVFYHTATRGLPSYAVPLFLRMTADSDLTGTFKLRKVELREQGYDPTRTDDPIYVKDDDARAYVRLHDIANVKLS